jgi:hypothetical protein
MLDRPKRTAGKRGTCRASSCRSQGRRSRARGPDDGRAPQEQAQAEAPLNAVVLPRAHGPAEHMDPGQQLLQPGPHLASSLFGPVRQTAVQAEGNAGVPQAAPGQDSALRTEEHSDEGGRAAREGPEHRWWGFSLGTLDASLVWMRMRESTADAAVRDSGEREKGTHTHTCSVFVCMCSWHFSPSTLCMSLALALSLALSRARTFSL